jgi:hypothetical protein
MFTPKLKLNLKLIATLCKTSDVRNAVKPMLCQSSAARVCTTQAPTCDDFNGCRLRGSASLTHRKASVTVIMFIVKLAPFSIVLQVLLLSAGWLFTVVCMIILHLSSLFKSKSYSS